MLTDLMRLYYHTAVNKADILKLVLRGDRKLLLCGAFPESHRNRNIQQHTNKT